MIEFTIKTLDSNNHPFSVEDDITVQQLKEKVHELLGIAISRQRLIFCGRVLQDEKKLSDYDVDGKVIHLVERLPPRSDNRPTTQAGGSATTSSGSGAGADLNSTAQQQIRRLMVMSGPGTVVLEDGTGLAMTPASSRMEYIRRTIAEIRTSITNLRAHLDSDDTFATPNTDGNAESREPSAAATAQEEVEPATDEYEEGTSELRSRVCAVRRRRNADRLRLIRSRPRDLAQLIEDLESVQQQFAPYRSIYARMLRSSTNTQQDRLTEAEQQRDQRTADMIADIIHSFAHAMHAVSDINLQVGQRYSRLNSEPSILRHPIPMQAQINMVQANRRPQQANASGGNGGVSATQTSGTATATAGFAAPPPIDPITYQVEIETRMPIAFALENAFLNGLTTAVNQQQAGGNQGQVPPPSAAGAPPPQPDPNQPASGQPTSGQPASGQPASGQPASGQPTQGNRRQVLFDFENLFRGQLGQGVEVVMSMEEIPASLGGTGGVGAGAGVGSGFGAGIAPGSGPGVDPSVGPGVGPGVGAGTGPGVGPGGVGGGGATGTGPTPQPVAGPMPAGATLAGGGVYLGAMPWGGAPNADLLQNIVSSVIRQGLVGVEGVLQAQVPQQPAQGAPQGGQNVPPQNGTTGQSQHQQSTVPPRLPNVHLRRASTTTRAVALGNVIYDRFLPCDSHHARRRVRRRREIHQQQMAAAERLRAERAATANIELLRERNPAFTQNHMQTLTLLLNNSQAQGAWMNALMVTIARDFFLPELLQPAAGEPIVLPNEFPTVRLMLRNSIERLIVPNTPGSENTFQQAAVILVAQYADFLNNLDTVTNIREEVDVYLSVQALVRRRLPAVYVCVMSDGTTDTFDGRFYRTFSRLFTDLCHLILYCCRDGVEGLRSVYNAFLDRITENFAENVREYIRTIATENLNHVLHVDETNRIDSIDSYIRRRDCTQPVDNSPTSLESYETPSPMEISASSSSAEEPMQTSPPATPYCENRMEVAADVATAPPRVAPSSAISSNVAPSSPAPSNAAPSSADLPSVDLPSVDLSSVASSSAVVPSSLDPPCDASSSPAQQVSSPASPAPVPSTSTTDTAISSAGSMRIPKIKITSPDRNAAANVPRVSPVLVMHHWGQEWMPVFSRDQERQSAAPQRPPEPYSDAYLSGMPARKRRRVREDRPPAHIAPLVTASLREANDRAVNDNTSWLGVAFRDYLRNVGRSRAASSTDYDPTIFTSAEQYLSPQRSSPEATPETSKESDLAND